MLIYDKKKYKLKEVFERIISGEWGDEVEVEENSENIVSVIRTTNFTDSGKLDLKNKEVTKRIISKSKIQEKKLIKGDIIIEKSGGSPNQPVGRVSYFDVEEGEYLCNNFTSILRVKKNINEKYMFYYLRNNYRLGRVLKYQNKTTGIINLKLSDYLESTYLEIPELKIQNKVVKILDTIDYILEHREKQLEKLTELTKSEFRNMFGDPLLPRKEWEFLKMSEVGKIVSGATPRTNIEEYWNGTHLWITPAEIKGGDNYLYSTERRITEKAIRNTNLELLPIGTVLLSSRAPIGKVAIVGKEMFCNQGFKNIVPNGKINSIYLYSLLKEKNEYLQFLGRGATFKEISKEILGNIKIKIPPIELQNKFAERIEQIDKCLFEVKNSIKELENLYNSLMDKYFN